MMLLAIRPCEIAWITLASIVGLIILGGFVYEMVYNVKWPKRNRIKKQTNFGQGLRGSSKPSQKNTKDIFDNEIKSPMRN